LRQHQDGETVASENSLDPQTSAQQLASNPKSGTRNAVETSGPPKAFMVLGSKMRISPIDGERPSCADHGLENEWVSPSAIPGSAYLPLKLKEI